MCTVLLPPGGYPIAVKYIISYITSYIENVLLHKLSNKHLREERGRRAFFTIFHVLMAFTFIHCRYKSSVATLITQLSPKYGPHSPK
jgi:hypothetical protein